MKEFNFNFNEVNQIYNEPQILRSECNDLTVQNIGTATAILNGTTIAPGDEYFVPCNLGEKNVTQYRLSFTGAGTEVVNVIRKIYV
jgi:hypothetical protein